MAGLEGIASSLPLIRIMGEEPTFLRILCQRLRCLEIRKKDIKGLIRNTEN